MPESASPPAAVSPWYTYVNIDLLNKVLHRTFLHPFIAWVIVLCFRAMHRPYTDPVLRVCMAYAGVLTLFGILSVFNERIAYGLPRDVDLAEEVIVITGGSSGLGQLIAEVYGMRNASIAVLDVEELENSELKGIEFYKCDVGDRKQVEEVAKKIQKDLGTPTILINNAGIVNGKSMLDLSPEEVERNFRVNLLSHFHTIQTFLPGMLEEDRGTIITVSSVLGHLGSAQLSDYAAAKAGLNAMHASLRAELAHSTHPSACNIRTVLCTLGQLSTPMFAGVQTPSNFFAPVVEPVEVAKHIINAIEGGRSGDISLPLYAWYIPYLGVLPMTFQKWLRSWSGVDTAMRGFIRKTEDKKARL